MNPWTSMSLQHTKSPGITPKRPSTPAHPSGLDVARIRQDFAGLAQRVNGKPLVYLDNAATAHKPRVVLEALMHAYTADCANIHRGVHTLSARATRAFEGVRQIVKNFIHADTPEEIVFVRGATEAINLVAASYGRNHVQSGDEIVITTMEHHSNIVPWQMLCAEVGAQLKIVPMHQDGTLDLDAYKQLLGENTKIVAISHVSNAIGTVNPVAEMTRLAHEHDAVVLVDGAQAAPHMAIDVQAIDCDFYVFSSHKVFGPTGVGVLYGRRALLDDMPPYQGGGDMIASVTFEKTTFNEVPHKFEAGTPDIAGVIAFGSALRYVQNIGMDVIAAYEQDLLQYTTAALSTLDGLTIHGQAPDKACVVSFSLEGVHPHDIGTILDQDGVAIRTGHHCAQPLVDFYGVPAMARASMAFYNTTEEVDTLVTALQRVQRMFKSHE